MNCPICEKSFDINTHVAGAKKKSPEPNDITICWGCHCVFIFVDANTLRIPTAAELKEIEADPGFAYYVDSVRNAVKNRPLLN